jgi:hypothetical protein
LHRKIGYGVKNKMKKKISLCVLSAIVLFSIVAMMIPTSAQVQMADEFGVQDAFGNPNTYVDVPVNITNTTNAIIGIEFRIVYDNTVINLTGIKLGVLTSTGWSQTLGGTPGANRIMLDTAPGNAIGIGESGSVVLLNFSVKNVPGLSSPMNISDIKLVDTALPPTPKGTAPAKNGTFRVDAGAPSVTNPTPNPGTIVADGIDETRLNVTVIDDIAVDVVVTINLTQIGGPAEKVMEKIDGTLYSTTTNASIGTTPGTYYLLINATDLLGNYNNTESFTLIIEGPTTGSISGKITYTCNTTGIAGATVNLTQGGSVIDSTVTDNNGSYTFANVLLGAYAVNASKLQFWDNATVVTVTAGAPAEADMMLWLKGDVYNDGVLDIYDIIMLRQAAAENIP